MGHKHLHELLKEEQEPFHLNNFISDHRTHLKKVLKPTEKTSLNVRKRKPIIEPTSSSTTAKNFCFNHVCLFAFQDSPEFKNSPFLDFPARELKSPCSNINNNNNNAGVFLNIPARTASMLLDAAARVQKPRPGSKQTGFGLLGSFLRRLQNRGFRAKNREIGPVYAIPTSSTLRKNRKKHVDKKILSTTLSEELSEKLPDMVTSCSSSIFNGFEEIECCCSNGSSPFRFALEPDPASSVVSPSRRLRQDKESHDVECPQDINREEDEDKEQCSPVSVLDPLYDDGDEEERRDGEATEEDYIECCYESVQRAKHQLLQKLQRFERLAGLDPIKLENHMLEQCYDKDEDDLVDAQVEMTDEERFREIVNHLGVTKIPWYMKKLVFDLIEEENKNEEHDSIVQRVCNQLQSWKVVELNTIDMMVETDFKSEGWKQCDNETVRDMGMDIEVAIFGFLMEELTQDLCQI